MTTDSHDDSGRPLSRREAREAAARTASGSIPTADVNPTPAVPEISHPATPNAAATTSQVAPSNDLPATDDEAERLRAEAAALFPRRGAVSDIASRPDTKAAPTVTEPRTQLHDLFDSAQAERVTKKRGGCAVALIVVVAILGGLVGGGFWAWNTYGEQIQSFFGKKESADYKAGEAEGSVSFTIKEGDDGMQISSNLYDAGVTASSDIFYDWLRANPPTPTFYPGTYQLQKKMTAAAVVAILKDPKNISANQVLIREGETLKSIVPQLSEATGIAEADFEAAMADPSVYSIAAPTLEGWLFPATYQFEPEDTAQGIVQQMIDRTVQSLDAAGVPVEKRQEILTIASIIQREAGVGDMGKVSRVIYNRLGPDNTETFGKLEMDSTVAYGVGKLHDGVVATTDDDRANDNPFNTYLHPGLPAGPISNSGDEAIDAAMHPEDGPWFYFVTVNLDTGETLFSTTYAEQQANEDKWHEWCDANPDSGCYD